MRTGGAIFFLLTVVALLVLGHAIPALAHKVHIFAYAEGNQIKTESRFNGGRPARNCEVAVHSLHDDTVLFTGSTDGQGFYAFAQPGQAVALDIVVSCGDGHRGSWRLEAQDYGTVQMESAPHVHQEAARRVPSAGAIAPDQEVIRAVVAQELEKKLGPLRRELARLAERKTSIQDILGGIGYLLGLAGLAAYLRYRKS